MRLIDADDFFRQFEELDIEPYNNVSTIEERPTGEWITRNGDIVFPFWERYECSVCHEYNGCSNFCPNCGADMRGDV